MTRSSRVATITATFPKDLHFWLKDPLNPAANMELSLQPGKLVTQSSDPQNVVFPIGRPDPVVLRDTIKLPSLQIPLRFLSETAYSAFENLRVTGRVLLFQAPQEIGQWYVILGDTKQDEVNLPTVRGWATQGVLQIDVTISAQAVAAPQ